MDEAKRRYKVTIDKKTYTIITTNTPEHMQAILQVINHQLAEIKAQMPAIDDVQAATLLALNAVSDQLGKQRKINALTDEIKLVQSNQDND